MAYTKQNFENGKVLTAEQLNQMDAGILEASQTAEALMQAKESGELNGKDGEPGKSAYDYAKEGGYIGTEAQFAAKLAQEYPTKVSDLTNDKGFITSADIPVKSVNGKTGAVSLSASEVGARPSDWMPTAEQVGARPASWTPTYSDVGAEKSGAAQSAVSEHNIGTLAHSDIRLLITALTNRMDALANSDDTTLDQLAEIVAYIKDNRGLIEQITTGKVSVSDIVNNLTTNVTNKPLSAAQGVALKALIDAIVIPTKLSQLTNDKGYLTGYTESDPTVPAWAKASTKPTYTAAEVGAVSPEELEKAKLLIVPILFDDTAPGEFYTTVPYSDILAALNAERMVCALVNNSLVAPVSSVRNQGVYFSTAYENMLYLFCVNHDNSVSFGIFEAADAEAVNALSINKLDASALPQAINTALAQAKASGEFDGKDGKNPVKGTDYWTEADREQIVQEVLTVLGMHVVGVVDENNNIVLSGELADGTYTFKYEDADGKVTFIGTVDIKPEIVNLVPLSINADGTPYVGTNGEDGYKIGYRLNSSGGETAQSYTAITGFIPVSFGETVYVDNMWWVFQGGSDAAFCYVSLYKSDFTYIRGGQATDSFISNSVASYTSDENNQLLSFTLDKSGTENVAYIRMSFVKKDGEPVITVNQPIPEEEPAYTNLIPTATDTDGVTIYNGVGYKADTRMSGTTGQFRDNPGCYCTGYMKIPESGNVVVRMKNITANTVDNYGFTINLFEGTGVAVTDNYNYDDITSFNPVLDDNGNVVLLKMSNTKGWTHMVITAVKIDETSIITVNEEIV